MNKKSILDSQNIATDRGGKCLSDKYIGAHSKLKWECSFGHIWEANYNNVKTGHWCPICSQGIGERLCRFIFESIFNEKFLKIRPTWLCNENTGVNLELDGYSPTLNIAFEYNGTQHYKEHKIFSRSSYDQLKIEKCKKYDVKLFLIREIKNMLRYKDILNQIKFQSNNFNIDVNTNIKVDLSKVYKTPASVYYLEDIKDIALKNNGKCLSNFYIDNASKLQFICNTCNYMWETSANCIKNGHWCPNCANKCISIKDAQKLASNKLGICLSDNYINSSFKMKWKCEFDHEWKASYNQIQSGSWCPICFKFNRGKSKKLSIDVYKMVAINKNGICLSDSITSCYDKLEWKCAEGHIWFSRADSIKNTKQWCPECAKQNRNIAYKKHKHK